MTHTLRRSKSKYGGTRRQRRKQRRIRGGGIFDALIEKITPSTPKQKCDKAREEAQLACSNVDGDIEMTEMGSEGSEDPMKSNANNESDAGSMSTLPQFDNFGANELSLVPPTKQQGVGSETFISPMTQPTSDAGSMSTLSQSDDKQSDLGTNYDESKTPNLQQENVGFGGGKKSRRRNKHKKRSHSRRKKLKSRRHKK
jgi:hypothetical protein